MFLNHMSLLGETLTHADLVTKIDFDNKLQILSKVLPQIKRRICLFKMN